MSDVNPFSALVVSDDDEGPATASGGDGEGADAGQPNQHGSGIIKDHGGDTAGAASAPGDGSQRGKLLKLHRRDEDDAVVDVMPSKLGDRPLSKKQRKAARKKQLKQQRRTLKNAGGGPANDCVANDEGASSPSIVGDAKATRLSRRVANILKASHRDLRRSINGRISEALQGADWDEALCLLVAMGRHNAAIASTAGAAGVGEFGGNRAIVPKLGALQRWVASLGDGASEDATALGLLDAMLRVADGLGGLDVSHGADCDVVSNNDEDGDDESPGDLIVVPFEGKLRMLEDWSAVPPSSPANGAQEASRKGDGDGDGDTCSSNDDAQDYGASFRVLTTVIGDERTPPNRHDLKIFELKEEDSGFVALDVDGGDKERGVAKSTPVPFAPGAFMISDLLSAGECGRFIRLSEQIGYVPDEPKYRSANSLVAATSAGLNDRAANFTLLADEASMLAPLLSRCRHLLPPELPDGSKLTGINARWRMYRYFPGAVYRPHVDGAWPPSGKEEDSSGGTYLYDSSGGTERSRFTFLIYLNEDFEGGATTFFTPSLKRGELGTVEARGVVPRRGCALVFPHGEGTGSLVHEGSAVARGTKYIIRTDVLYSVPGASSPPCGTKRKRHGNVIV